MATLLSIRATIDEDGLRDTFEIAGEKQIETFYEEGKRRKARQLKRIMRSERRSEMAFQYALDNSITAFIASGNASTQEFGDGSFLDWFKDGGWESIIAFLERLIPLLLTLFGSIAFLAIMLMPLEAMAQSCPNCPTGNSFQSVNVAPATFSVLDRSYGSSGSSFVYVRSGSVRRWTPFRNMLGRMSNRRSSRINARQTRRASFGSNGSRLSTRSFTTVRYSGLSSVSPQVQPAVVTSQPRSVSCGWLGDPIPVAPTVIFEEMEPAFCPT